MLNRHEILETIEMIENEHLDIRTITMAISLLDCRTPDEARKKIVGYAGNLKKTGDDIEREFGIPIINKRVAVTPVSLIANRSNFLEFAANLDQAAHDIGIDFLGGYTVLVHKGYKKDDIYFLDSLPEALAMTERLCSSVNAATTKAGINMNAVARMGHIIKEIAKNTPNGVGCAKLVVFANAAPDNPFMAGAFCDAGEPECVINVGVSGPGVVAAALRKSRGLPLDEVAETIKRTAFKITRMGQLVAAEASKRLNVPFGIVDLSLAPTPAVGDSVAGILEEIGLERCGAPGTTAALALLNDAVKKGGVMASSHVGGLSGAFIPVSEDALMIDAVNAGALSLEKLEAMTAVCSVGLDMVVVPGDTSAETLTGIIADEMAIGVVNNKTTAVRIIPAKSVGETVDFGGLLGSGPVMEVSKFSSAAFAARGGRIPAPMASLTN